MDPQDQAGEPRTLGITAGEIEAICAQTEFDAFQDSPRYQATKQQTFFFTLVWVMKKRLRQRAPVLSQARDDFVHHVDKTGVQQRTQLVAQFLHEWGEAVVELKQVDARRWELLRIQMEKALKSFDCPVEMKDDAIQITLVKMHRMLGKMPISAALEATVDLDTFVVEHQADLKGIYDFGTPLYGYAQRAVRNEMINQLKSLRIESLDEDGWDEAITIALDDAELADEEVRSYPQILKKLLKRLFFLIQTQLTPMPAKVIWHTLAGRSQFWLALTITELKPPITLHPTPGASDADNAETLDISENALRVHRNHAKKTIYTIDLKAGELLEVLLDRHLSKHLNDWPEI